jgi:hypothetical protein
MDLFKLRQVCTEWNDMIKAIWCQVVKKEMLKQVENLDLLYEKETTSKLLEFKLKYLVSYAQLMRNYFINMVFHDIMSELIRTDSHPENADLFNLGQKMILISALIVRNQDFPRIESVEAITPEQLVRGCQVVLTDEFRRDFESMCQMDFIPEIEIGEIKHIKT